MKIKAWFIVCFVAASPVRSQEEQCLTRAVPILIRDAHSLPIEGITPQDLVAKVEGKSVRMVSIHAEPHPRRIVILLDTSSSMKGTSSEQTRLPLDIASHLARSVSPSTQLALLTFDDNVHSVIDFSRDNSAVLTELNRISKEFPQKHTMRRTAIYDAAYHGWQLLRNPSSADLLFVISDGGDNASSLKLVALEKTLLTSGVRFFAIAVRDLTVPSRGRSPEEDEGPRLLSEIAEKTGGEVFGPVGFRLGGRISFVFSDYSYTGKAKLEDALNWFYAGIMQSEVMEIQLPAVIPSEKESLEVKLSEAVGHKWKRATLTYPRKLPRCDARSEPFGENSVSPD